MFVFWSENSFRALPIKKDLSRTTDLKIKLMEIFRLRVAQHEQCI